MYKRLASSLARRGISSLRIDFAGSGDSPLPFTANTYDGMVEDSRVALDYLVGLPSTEDDRIGLVGFSLGGRVAMTVAGTDARIKALATWSGAAANGTTNLQFFFDVYYPIAQAQGHVVVDLGFRTVDLSLAWFETIRASRALDQIAAYRNPLLAIAGENDTVVDPVWSRELVRHSGSFDATLRIIPGADHIFNVLTPDQTNAKTVLKLTTAWFVEKV
jgi:dienelactone hydrolase